MKKSKTFIQPSSTAVDSIVPKNSAIIPGTKLIYSDQPHYDFVFKTIDDRMNGEPSVLFWKYESGEKETSIEVEFIDEAPLFRILFNPYDVDELEQTIRTIDSYFLTRYSRS